MKKGDIPPEFIHLRKRKSIPWDDLVEKARETTDGGKYFKAFTDVAIELATKESMKDSPKTAIIILGMEACLARSRFAESLFISTDSVDVEVLSLRSITLSVLQDAKGLREVFTKMNSLVSEDSSPSDQIRLATVKVMLAAAERDTSIIICFMEFDNLLDTYPEQVEDPLTETMFTLYVVGNLLNIVGQMQRSARIADALEEMARSKNHRPYLALVENIKGTTRGLLGDFEQAEVHFRKVLDISEELSFKLGLAVAMNNLGKLMLNAIKLEEAYEYFLAAHELMEMDAHRLVSLTNLGEITAQIGRYDESEEYLTEAIRIDQKVGVGLIEAYTNYTILLAKTKRLRKGWEVLRQAQRLAETTEKPRDRVAYLHANGYLESQEGSVEKAGISIMEALEIAKERGLFEWLIRLKFDIAKLYLDAFTNSQKMEFLVNAVYHLDDIIQIAQEQGLQALYAEGLLLRSEIRISSGRLFEAKGDIERAGSVAKFLEDTRLIAESESKTGLIEEASRQTIELDSDGISKVMDRVSAFRPAGRLKEVPRPVLHTIIALNRFSGLPEFVHHFDEKLEMDSSLFGGFITAIATFSDEMMGESGLIRSINHEGFTLMMEYTPSRIVTLVANQETFDVRFRLHQFTKRYELTFPASVDSVTPSAYEGARDILVTIFAEEEETMELPF